MLKEFKEFISRGNVIDLAVGVIIGGAFGKIVTSFVGDIVSPLIGLITGSTDLSSLVWTIKAGELTADGEVVGAVIVNYGAFILAIMDFLIIAFAIFMAIKFINKFKRKEEEKVEEEVVQPSETEVLLNKILQELKQK